MAGAQAAGTIVGERLLEFDPDHRLFGSDHHRYHQLSSAKIHDEAGADRDAQQSVDPRARA